MGRDDDQAGCGPRIPHTHAGVYMARSWPMETIFISILLEHGKMIEEILALKERKRIVGWYSLLFFLQSLWAIF